MQIKGLVTFNRSDNAR